MRSYFSQVRRILWIILALNWSVALAKLIYGTYTSCASMVADGMHSIADGSINVIGLLGIWIASKPVDKNHPYGHKKYETFTALAVGFLLLVMALGVIRDAFERLRMGAAPTVNILSFVVMAITMCVNLLVIIYERNKGLLLGSDLLVADALHTRSDILVSTSVLIALVTSKMGYPKVDAISAFIIAGFIAKTGYEIARHSSSILCDSAVLAVEEIKKIALQIDGVKACHEIRTRGRADDIHVDLHLIVDTDMAVGVAHGISHMVEDRIKTTVKGVTDVVVHIEPAPAKRSR